MPDRRLAADAAFIAKWCAAFFDQGQALLQPDAQPRAGAYRAVLAAIGHDPDFRALTSESGRHLLLSVPRDPLEAIAEGLPALGIPAGQKGRSWKSWWPACPAGRAISYWLVKAIE